MTITARGKRMPQTPEQFAEMADLYEQALITKGKEIGRLQNRINNLEQQNKRLLRIGCEQRERYAGIADNYYHHGSNFIGRIIGRKIRESK